jgi:endonuclease G
MDATTVVGKLEVGEEAEIIDEASGYWEILLDDGTEGFVSKAWATELIPFGSADGPGDAIFMGTPMSTDQVNEITLLHNVGFTVGYSEARQTPLWVAYRLEATENAETIERPSSFRVDRRTEAQVDHDCYTNSEFDRGHMAPNFAMVTRFGRVGQLASFLMSNVSTQEPELNRGTWEAFEKVVANQYANGFGGVWVVTGPVYGSDPDELPCGVEVPVAFYKIVARQDDEATVAMLAVMMSQSQSGSEQLSNLTTTVREIEELVGLDFFPDLPDDVEETAETAEPADLWNTGQLLVPSFFSAENID